MAEPPFETQTITLNGISPMKTHLVGCPDRKCHVRMVWAQVFPDGGDEARGVRDVVCLDADDACSDPVCPLFSIATARMKDRLRRFHDRRPWVRDWDG